MHGALSTDKGTGDLMLLPMMLLSLLIANPSDAQTDTPVYRDGLDCLTSYQLHASRYWDEAGALVPLMQLSMTGWSADHQGEEESSYLPHLKLESTDGVKNTKEYFDVLKRELKSYNKSAFPGEHIRVGTTLKMLERLRVTYSWLTLSSLLSVIGKMLRENVFCAGFNPEAALYRSTVPVYRSNIGWGKSEWGMGSLEKYLETRLKIEESLRQRVTETRGAEE